MLSKTTNARDERPRRASGKRLSLAVLPAGIITVSLFAVMQQLIVVDDFSAPEPTVYELEPFMEAKIAEPLKPLGTRLIKLDPIDPPPRPPSLVKDIHKVDLPISGYEGGVPAEYGPATFKPILPERVSAIRARTLQPVTPPVPVYPRRAADMNLEGDCEVSLSVSIRGEPFNVAAQCTDRVFESAARKAVQKVKFVPQIRDGLPVTGTGVVYPLEFRMEP